jgi:hypothetical protein
VDLYLIVARESILEEQGLMANAVIDNLVNERCREVIFGTRMVEIKKVGADTNGALFLLMGTGLETHDVYSMGYMNPTMCSLSISSLIVVALDWCSGHCFWCTGVISIHVSIRCSTIEGSRSGISMYDQEKMSHY